MWDDARIAAFDFETSGILPEYALQPWRARTGKAWPTSLVWLYRQNGETVVKGGLSPDVAMMREMLEWAVANDITLLGWNTVFDIQWLLVYGLDDLVFKLKWLDGMLLWRHAFIEPEYEQTGPNKKSYGLKACVAQLLPQHAGYEESIDFHNPDPEARAKLHRYNIKDNIFTLRLAKHWYQQLAADPQRLRAALIEAECLPLVAKANLEGMVVDQLAGSELRAYLTQIADKMLALLAPHGVSEAVVRSPLQLSKLLFDVWGLPVLKENVSKKTGKTSRSTDKEVLHELSFRDERALQLRAYREALNNRTKFADAPVTAAEYNGDGRARPQAIVFGTYSGRLTYASKQGKGKDERQTGFALHQEKRGAEFRSLIIAPPGYTLMEFDAAGQEFRWMAIASNDPVMLGLCAEGEDAHSYMAAAITGKGYRELVSAVEGDNKEAKADRQLGKVANLSLQYRTSARKLRSVARVQYSLPMELPQAELIHRTYQRTYPGVPAYWARQIQLARGLGYVETFAGRRVQVVGNWDGPMGWSMGSTAINYRIQGTGADQKYLALAVLKSYLTEIGAYFAWDLHDGIYLYVPDAQVERAKEEIKKILASLPYEAAWGFSPPVPLPWDCKVGKSWGTLKGA